MLMATRYVLRMGEIIYSNRNPEELDVYCYQTGANDYVCLFFPINPKRISCSATDQMS